MPSLRPPVPRYPRQVRGRPSRDDSTLGLFDELVGHAQGPLQYLELRCNERIVEEVSRTLRDTYAAATSTRFAQCLVPPTRVYSTKQ